MIKFINDEQGATAVEYGILAVLVSGVSLLLVTFFLLLAAAAKQIF